MIIIADIKTREILRRYEAWAPGAYEQAQLDAALLGNVIDEEITLMGDMIIWVEL